LTTTFLGASLLAAIPLSAVVGCGSSAPSEERVARSTAALSVHKCPESVVFCPSNEEKTCQTVDGCSVCTCTAIPLPAPSTLLTRLDRVPGPGDPFYDISIVNIQESNTLHADNSPGAESDVDHVYFAVTGKGEDGSNPYSASFNDGQSNYYNTVPLGGSGAGPSGPQFVLQNLAILPADTLYFSVQMDSRNNASLATTLAGFQSQLVSFAALRAQAQLLGSSMDLEALPWDPSSPTPTDANNLPIWEWNDGTVNSYLNPAIGQTPEPNCDGYTGDLNFSIPGSAITAIQSEPDGTIYSFSRPITVGQPVICATAAYPQGSAGYPDAQAKGTITFQAVVHHTPVPNLGGYVCNPGPLTLVPPGGAPDSAWVGQWRDAQSNAVTVQIEPDGVEGLDVDVTEDGTCGSSGGALEVSASAQGDTALAFVNPYEGGVATNCGGTSELHVVDQGQTINLYSQNIWLELYQYTCTNLNGPPQYVVRYTRTNGEWAALKVMSDYMLYYQAPLP
jgi:hypothetical protein